MNKETMKLQAIYETIIQWDEGGGKRSRRELARRIVALETSNEVVSAVAEQPAQQEPIGELTMGGIVDTSSGHEYGDWDAEWDTKAVEALQERLVTGDAPVTVSLYTSPPTSKPLMDEQIRNIWSNGDCFEEIAFARAIEAAHGITGETK